MIFSSAPVSSESFSRPLTHSAMNGSPTGDGISRAIGLSPVGTAPVADAAGAAGSAGSEAGCAAEAAAEAAASDGAGATPQPASRPAQIIMLRSIAMVLFISNILSLLLIHIPGVRPLKNVMSSGGKLRPSSFLTGR